MSYCRSTEFDSDIYLYCTDDGSEDGILVCGCAFKSAHPPHIIAHLQEHVAAGDLVPERLMDIKFWEEEFPD